MSTKKTDTQTNTYDPQSMAAYHSLMGQGQGVLNQYMQDPLKASYFNTQAQMANQQIGQMGQTNMTNLLRNSQMYGGGGANPYLQSLMAQQSRATSGQQSNAFNQLLMGAQQNRQWATGQAMGFKPLQTGGQNVQQTGGLGSWLPQVAGTALGIGLGAATGGTSTMMGGGVNPFLHGTAGAFQAANTPMQPPTGGSSQSLPFQLPNF